MEERKNEKRSYLKEEKTNICKPLAASEDSDDET